MTDNLKILYADGDPNVRAKFCMDAYYRGHEIHGFPDGDSAFDGFMHERQKGKFDLAIVQWHMSGRAEGEGLINKLREAGFNGAVAIKTGTPENLAEYAEANGIFHVSHNPTECLDAYERKVGIKD